MGNNRQSQPRAEKNVLVAVVPCLKPRRFCLAKTSSIKTVSSAWFAKPNLTPSKLAGATRLEKCSVIPATGNQEIN